MGRFHFLSCAYAFVYNDPIGISSGSLALENVPTLPCGVMICLAITQIWDRQKERWTDGRT